MTFQSPKNTFNFGPNFLEYVHPSKHSCQKLGDFGQYLQDYVVSNSLFWICLRLSVIIRNLEAILLAFYVEFVVIVGKKKKKALCCSKSDWWNI